MNAYFKILWFEDELPWYLMEQVRVKAILEQHFLSPIFTRKTGDDFNMADLVGNDYDLILMDYKLADSVTGDTIVTAIREHSILTDILFYSSQEQEMLAAISSNMPPIDGVYLTQRDYTVFTEKVDKLILKIIRRSEDIVNLRGFVMDCSCDLEVRVLELLNNVWAKLTDEERTSLDADAHRNICGLEIRSKATIEEAKNNPQIYISAINNNRLFCHSDRLYMLVKVIELLQRNHGMNVNPLLINFKGKYEAAISCYRNALGHRKAREMEIEVRGQFVPIDETLHRLMRRNLSQYSTLISELEAFVDSI